MYQKMDLKPSAPHSPLRGGLQSGGRIDLQGFSLKQLILVAWGLVSPNQNPGSSCTDLPEHHTRPACGEITGDGRLCQPSCNPI